MLLVDTNVLLDVVTNDRTWAGWSQAELDAAVATDTAVVNAVIYAELSLAFDRIEDLEAQLSKPDFGWRRFHGSAVPRGEGVPAISPPRRVQRRGAAGFLHWRACGRDGHFVVDPGYLTLSHVLSRRRLTVRLPGHKWGQCNFPEKIDTAPVFCHERQLNFSPAAFTSATFCLISCAIIVSNSFGVSGIGSIA